MGRPSGAAAEARHRLLLLARVGWLRLLCMWTFPSARQAGCLKGLLGLETWPSLGMPSLSSSLSLRMRLRLGFFWSTERGTVCPPRHRLTLLSRTRQILRRASVLKKLCFMVVCAMVSFPVPFFLSVV